MLVGSGLCKQNRSIMGKQNSVANSGDRQFSITLYLLKFSFCNMQFFLFSVEGEGGKVSDYFMKNKEEYLVTCQILSQPVASSLFPEGNHIYNYQDGKYYTNMTWPVREIAFFSKSQL